MPPKSTKVRGSKGSGAACGTGNRRQPRLPTVTETSVLVLTAPAAVQPGENGFVLTPHVSCVRAGLDRGKNKALAPSASGGSGSVSGYSRGKGKGVVVEGFGRVSGSVGGDYRGKGKGVAVEGSGRSNGSGNIGGSSYH